ncbi:MAG TPA: type IV secretion system protein [Caulobacteraceae bacterium]|nr:type IV secretion system protein [Caulobacteraceae bacterium]
MSSACPATLFDVGIVRDILGSVDCNVQHYSAAGYQALAGPGSPLPAAMTALLTIYVALLGYRMLFAVEGIRLAQAPLIALKIGVILALTVNWSVFQTLVFNLGAQAPLEIGRVISRPMATGEPSLANDPVAGIQTSYDELNADAAELAKKAGQAAGVLPGQIGPPGATPTGAEAATATDLRRAAAALLASTAGVLGMAFIATGVLTAVGPVFIALLLFDVTGGFFTGWVRALVAAILIPMVCWVTASVLLVVLAPRIEVLAQQRAAHAINLDAAAAASAIVLIFAAAQAALIIAGLIIAGGFRLGRRGADGAAAPAAAREARSTVEVVEARSRAEILATSLRRSATASPREHAIMVSAGSAAAPGDVEIPHPEAAVRTARLGETYRRRAAVGDRPRLGARV